MTHATVILTYFPVSFSPLRVVISNLGCRFQTSRTPKTSKLRGAMSLNENATGSSEVLANIIFQEINVPSPNLSPRQTDDPGP